MNPKVSVIIPNYNYEKFIAATIESVLSQTYENIEIIVVDDGSKDNSLKVLERFGEKLRVIQQKNAGVSAARNNGVQNSTGEFIAFLDADDIWLPEKLQRQIERFNADSEVGLVHCSMTLIDPQDQPIDENRNGQEGWVSTEFLRFERGVVVGASSTALVKRSIFDEIGGFDVCLSTAADWDFCYQVSRKYKFGFVTEPLVLYRMHGTNMHGNIKAMEHDMLLGFEKAFAENSEDLQKIRKECYGNLYMTLAGSYYQTKNYSKFVEMAQKSLKENPSKITQLAGYPIRLLKRLTK
jgi:glycosyltransferase involved in cell wall biosynthesis